MEMKKSLAPHLEDRQSVRTTFRITEEASKDIAWFAKKNRITQKEVFDKLFEQTLLASETDGNTFFQSLLPLAAGGCPEWNRTVRKSQVISRKALQTLNKISKERNVSRDVLVEYAVRFLKLLMEKMTETRKEAAEIYKKEVRDKFLAIPTIMLKIQNLLGDDDPIVVSLGELVSHNEEFDDEIMAEIKKLEEEE
jgi:hypothetical protein